MAISSSLSRSSSSRSSKSPNVSSSLSNAETVAFFFLPFSCSSNHASSTVSEPANSSKSILFALSYTSPSSPRDARLSSASSISACVCSPRTSSPGSTYSYSSDSSGFSSTKAVSSGCSVSETTSSASTGSTESPCVLASASCSDSSFSSFCSVSASIFCSVSASSFTSSSSFGFCSDLDASSKASGCGSDCVATVSTVSSASSSKSSSSKLKSSSLSSSSFSWAANAFFNASISCASFAISTADFVSLTSCGSGLAACCAALASSTADTAPVSGVSCGTAATSGSSGKTLLSSTLGVSEVFLEMTSPIRDSISSWLTVPPLWLIIRFRFSKIVSLITPRSAFASSDKIISAFSCTTSWLIMRSISSENAGVCSVPCAVASLAASPVPSCCNSACELCACCGKTPTCSLISSGTSVISSGATPASNCFSL